MKIVQFIITIFVTTLIVVFTYEICKELTKLEKEIESLEFYKLKLERIKIAKELKADIEYDKLIHEVDSLLQLELNSTEYAERK